MLVVELPATAVPEILQQRRTHMKALGEVVPLLRWVQAGRRPWGHTAATGLVPQKQLTTRIDLHEVHQDRGVWSAPPRIGHVVGLLARHQHRANRPLAEKAA